VVEPEIGAGRKDASARDGFVKCKPFLAEFGVLRAGKNIFYFVIVLKWKRRTEFRTLNCYRL
jgi:hypothetical protein